MLTYLAICKKITFGPKVISQIYKNQIKNNGKRTIRRKSRNHIRCSR